MDEGRKEESQDDEPAKIPGGTKDNAGKAEVEEGNADGEFFEQFVSRVVQVSINLLSNPYSTFNAGNGFQQNSWGRRYFLGKEKDCAVCRIRINGVLALMCHFRM